ncbi:hypothetical protein PM082_018669 [Marasmius tenuissimus]|nr:hypothetical protein PM082_018669 [Marasmius tenuissimus]
MPKRRDEDLPAFNASDGLCFSRLPWPRSVMVNALVSGHSKLEIVTGRFQVMFAAPSAPSFFITKRYAQSDASHITGITAGEGYNGRSEATRTFSYNRVDLV